MRPDADRELALFGTTGYQQDREGIGIYTLPDGNGYIVSVDQLPGESIFHVYRREGEPGRPHDHSTELLSFKGGADGTDGLDVTSASLGPGFSRWPAGRDEQPPAEFSVVPLAGCGDRRHATAEDLERPLRVRSQRSASFTRNWLDIVVSGHHSVMLAKRFGSGHRP